MKKRTWALLPFAISMLLASCQGGGSTSSSDPIQSSTGEVCPDDPLEELSDVQFDLSISALGHLNDFGLGIPALVGKEHLLSFAFGDADTNGAVVKTDRECVAIPEKKGDKWFLRGLHAGKTHLTIEDAEGVLHYRTTLEVVDPLEESEAKEELHLVDHWEVKPGFELFCGNFSVTFLDDLSATMEGVESGGVDLSGASFSVELDNAVLTGGEEPEYWYGFKVLNWQIPDFNLSAVMLHKSGKLMHLHTNNALLGIMTPAEAK